MRRNLSIVSALVVFVGLVSTGGLLAESTAEKTAVEAAQLAAQSWLAVVDSGKYTESWSQASELFKKSVTVEQWENALHSVRGSLGKFQSRRVTSAQYTKALPGAPDGEYVVIQYESAFENKKAATETVTPMKDKDGQWRVSGYFIK